ncbi:MAG TPA: hypothetical protein VLK27_09985 [Chthoniobacterales bacterium]|nr:hypothetical protein [Chthoniobacterales bacterium]
MRQQRLYQPDRYLLGWKIWSEIVGLSDRGEGVVTDLSARIRIVGRAGS